MQPENYSIGTRVASWQARFRSEWRHFLAPCAAKAPNAYGCFDVRNIAGWVIYETPDIRRRHIQKYHSKANS